MGLKQYAEGLFLFFKDRCDSKRLRDEIVSDLLMCGANEHIPELIKVYDPLYKKAKKLFGGDRKSVAVLYSKDSFFVVDKSQKRDFLAAFKAKQYLLNKQKSKNPRAF